MFRTLVRGTRLFGIGNPVLFITQSRCRSSASLKGHLKYTQGQYNPAYPTIREYFYYIDHNGMLFLDDSRMKNFTSCFKEQKFLRFFFRNVKLTVESSSFRVHFPYTSLCGNERNYVRVNGSPFVFTNFSEDGSELEYNGTGWRHPFRPESLYVASNGRLYHEFRNSKVVKFALVKSSVADLISPQFVHNDKEMMKVPIAYKIEDTIVELDYGVREDVEEAIRNEMEAEDLLLG